MMFEERYLQFLGIQKAPPTISFLSNVVARHLSQVPYENISKVIRFHEFGPSMPSFDQFVLGLIEKSYGGTCFIQNIYLNHILNDLGFDSKLVQFRKAGVTSHVNLLVKIEDANYFVDVGIMSSFAGPFRVHPQAAFKKDLGNQTFIFSPKMDSENYILEIWRHGKMIRQFESSSEPISPQDIEIGLKKTFEPASLFMTTLCIHRVFETHSVGIWNKSFYKIKGTEYSSHPIETHSDLKYLIKKELNVPQYDIDFAIEVIQRNNGVNLFEV